jgi:hypothetical protein
MVVAGAGDSVLWRGRLAGLPSGNFFQAGANRLRHLSRVARAQFQHLVSGTSMTDFFIHRNGGGKVLSFDTHISPDSKLDRDSVLEGYCVVGGESRVLASRVFESAIDRGQIIESLLERSEVMGGLVAKSGLRNAHVASERKHRPELFNVMLDGVTVRGATFLRGFHLKGPFLIHAGQWYDAPRHFHFAPRDTGINLGIIECVDGRAHIGCVCRPMEQWIARRPLLDKIFARRGWLPAYTKFIETLFRSWSEPISPEGNLQSA